MARQDALLRLHQRLIGQREALRKKLREDVDRTGPSNSGSGDISDVAIDDAEREINSQLVSLESRELSKIDRAIDAIRQGRYGTCEVCSRAIPIARLQALPYTTLCVECQRLQESGVGAGDGEADWESVYEYQARQHDQELTLDDIRIEG
ncbi:General stress protein 16O [Maioricimonas rarisocia]|uniref:General stress protein 16O n=1 Tax=Maioricimonas rarisocia TaxID=2528026 RepID=A0A517Z9R6_9PLAN|nr:TraR/DksA C4-type zinc finger protein [Maioricimonas rarisocia]QDU39227.1 General stress protein 16O [Maioricimonas rarisocia]